MKTDSNKVNLIEFTSEQVKNPKSEKTTLTTREIKASLDAVNMLRSVGLMK